MAQGMTKEECRLALFEKQQTFQIGDLNLCASPFNVETQTVYTNCSEGCCEWYDEPFDDFWESYGEDIQSSAEVIYSPACV